MNGLVALNPEYPTALGAIVGGLSLGLDCVCVCDGHGWALEGGLTGVWFLGEGPADRVGGSLGAKGTCPGVWFQGILNWLSLCHEDAHAPSPVPAAPARVATLLTLLCL